jgi:hypothetical protein
VRESPSRSSSPCWRVTLLVQRESTGEVRGQRRSPSHVSLHFMLHPLRPLLHLWTLPHPSRKMHAPDSGKRTLLPLDSASISSVSPNKRPRPPVSSGTPVKGAQEITRLATRSSEETSGSYCPIRLVLVVVDLAPLPIHTMELGRASVLGQKKGTTINRTA